MPQKIQSLIVKTMTKMPSVQKLAKKFKTKG